MATNESGYQIGFGKPPKRTQFKPGQSGNAKGRPKGSLNLSTILHRELKERVVINENGRRKTISKFEAAMKQMVNKSASGDLNAQKLLYSTLRSAAEEMERSPVQPKGMTDSDQKVMQGVLGRLALSVKEASVESDSN